MRISRDRYQQDDADNPPNNENIKRYQQSDKDNRFNPLDDEDNQEISAKRYG